jgi:hypothetical protein
LSHKDAMEPVLWSEANDEACIVTVTPPSHVKHRDAVRSMVWGIGFAVAWNQRLRVGEPRRNRTSPSLNTVSPWSNLLPEGRLVFFDATTPRSEVTAPSHRTYPASQTFASWNQIGHVLRRLEAFRSAAGSAYGAIHISKGP